jgi:hypothetical protein
MARPTTRVAGEPPQIRLGWPRIGAIAGVEIGRIAIQFGDLLVTGLRRMAVECRSTVRRTTVRFGGVFG